jgi:hypothetical protein
MWTDQELEFLKVNAAKRTRGDIAKVLRKTRSAVLHMCRKLNLPSKRVSHVWTDSELELLVNLSRTSTANRSHIVRQAARELGRPVNSVWTKAYSLQLWPRVKEQYKLWTKTELHRLMLDIESHTVRELAQMYGRSRSSIQYKITELSYTPLCGVYSVARATRVTGYHESQLHRARRAIKQRWRRSGKYWIITEKQLSALTEWLGANSREAQPHRDRAM